MYQILQYLKFWFYSTNQHGIHSPFVFDLVTKCFYDRRNYKAHKKLKAYRKALLSNHQKINITDFGAGSKRFSTTQRSVKDIAKTSGTSFYRAKLLFRMVNYFKPQQILELGTSLGIATQAMALGNEEAKVTSIEGSTTVSSMANTQLGMFQIKNVVLKTGRFEDVLSKLKTSRWDVVFFDGNHQKEPTLNYFQQLLPTTHNDTLFIFDDIYWSKAMTEAWHSIKQHPQVTVTIDTFFWGMVFFKKELTKENFKIRL